MDIGSEYLSKQFQSTSFECQNIRPFKLRLDKNAFKNNFDTTTVYEYKCHQLTYLACRPARKSNFSLVGRISGKCQTERNLKLA